MTRALLESWGGACFRFAVTASFLIALDYGLSCQEGEGHPAVPAPVDASAL